MLASVKALFSLVSVHFTLDIDPGISRGVENVSEETDFIPVEN